MEASDLNTIVLAYIGDSVYEVMVRKYLILNKINKVNDLQKASINYVSAKSQAVILDKLLNRQILTDEELYTVLRARNKKYISKPKSAKALEYKKATALEALFGMLYLKNDIKRIDELFKEIVGE